MCLLFALGLGGGGPYCPSVRTSVPRFIVSPYPNSALASLTPSSQLLGLLALYTSASAK